ncbi:MAG: ATPase, T2SS/T4P/T4SS family [Christensenellales bacterium]
MIADVLPQWIYNEIINRGWSESLTEIRIRVGKPIFCALMGSYCKLTDDNEVATLYDLQYVIDKACTASLYAFDDEITQGFITTAGGIRIGISGQGVVKGGKLSAIKNFSSICIRVPKDVKDYSSKVERVLNNFDNTIIFSKPGLGKTTLLRNMIRQLSNQGNNVLVLDERMEIAGDCFDLGECSDVVAGVPKNLAYANHIKSMRPDVIATDEIFSEQEVDCILDSVRSGVKVLATVHADDLGVLLSDKVYGALLDKFRYFVHIDSIGHVDKVYDKELTCLS